MLLKILLVGVLIAGGMAALKDGRLLAKAGLVGVCRPVVVGGRPDGSLLSCSKGRLEGYPNLEKKSCNLAYVRARHDYWRCPAPIVVSQSPRG